MRRRIISVGLITAVVALVLFGVPLALALRQLYLSDEQGELERDALRAAVAVDPAFAAGDPVEFPATDAATDLGLYDSTGRLVAGTGPASADQAATLALAGKVSRSQDRGTLAIAVPVSSGEQVIGAVRASTPSTTVWHRVILTWLAMVGLAVLAVGVAVLIARRQARILAQPLVDLAQVADDLGDGDFGVRSASSGIPEIDRASDALNVTAARLGDVVARERAFAANASHQLRTPLTGLRLALEAALAGGASDLRPGIVEALTSADRLEQTIDDLIASTNSPTVSQPLPVLSVNQVLDEVRDRWHGVLAADSRRLRLLCDDDGLVAQAFAGGVRQILDVLIDNAMRHGFGTVTVHARDAGSAVGIDVSDEGPGIDAAVGDVFVRGVSGDGGQGIGLALAANLASDQGGRLLLSQTSPAARFTLLLPAVSGVSPTDQRAPS